MRAFAFLCLWFLFSGFTPSQQVVALNPQVRPANASAGLPAVDDDFTTAGYPVAGGICAEWGHRVPCSNHYSVTRSGAVATCVLADGMVSLPFAVNIMRNCNGAGQLVEDTRTNDALWARDMTNAAWTKVGMGTALNAIGADGTANSATTLTATGTASSCTASCTVLQTITLGSSADTYSVYLMRVTGTGAVNVTINNLVGTTACTLVTTAWTRCSVTATLANPVFGIQMATLNDVIVADFNQLEPGSFATSPIATTTVTVTRATETTTLIGSAATIMGGAGFSAVVRHNGAPANTGTLLGSSSVFFSPVTSTLLRLFNATNTLDATLGSGTMAGVVKGAFGVDGTGRSAVGNGGAVATDANAKGTWSTLGFGNSGAGSASINTYMRNFSLAPSKLPNATLQTLTVP